MNGAANRGEFVRLAGRWSSTEPDAVFCVQTAALMGNLHNGDHPLARITTFGDFPIGLGKDGTTIVALQWDHAAWTPAAARFSTKVQKFATEQAGKKKVLIAVSGETSRRLRDEAKVLATS